ncbi:hypothetical protein L1W90_07240, partial [Acinetobacter baumannii]|nr:hypothetical protein [Acinetobacter baumannii]MCF4326668.1 hypothetical protein [Acinetobacter baumannii]MCF4474855.1 hypothetical protein [Acinetobacter baumannii]
MTAIVTISSTKVNPSCGIIPLIPRTPNKTKIFYFLETFARNSPFARGIPPNRKKTKNGNE